jgi:hypothetical protein
VTVESVPEGANMVLGMFLINSVPALVLFDSRASHSFITKSFMEKYNILIYLLRRKLLIRSPGGEMSPSLMPRTKLGIEGIEFVVELIILGSRGIDVIIGLY